MNNPNVEKTKLILDFSLPEEYEGLDYDGLEWFDISATTQQYILEGDCYGSDDGCKFLLKMAPNAPLFYHWHTNTYDGIVLTGTWWHHECSDPEPEHFAVGEGWRTLGGEEYCHADGNDGDEESILYIEIYGIQDFFECECAGILFFTNLFRFVQKIAARPIRFFF